MRGDTDSGTMWAVLALVCSDPEGTRSQSGSGFLLLKSLPLPNTEAPIVASSDPGRGPVGRDTCAGDRTAEGARGFRVPSASCDLRHVCVCV